jgi:hypothetical protein
VRGSDKIYESLRFITATASLCYMNEIDEKNVCRCSPMWVKKFVSRIDGD